jgi:cytochrome P450
LCPRQHEESIEAPAERPDELDRSFDYFHKHGTQISWWGRGGGYWFISGYDLVSEVAVDHASFSSRHDLPNGATHYLGVMIPPSPIMAPPLEADPPQHTIMRNILRGRLSGDAARRRPRIAELTDAYIDGRAGAGWLDICELAQLVCCTTVLELVGLPAGRAGVLADASQVEATMSKKAELAWGRLIEDLLSAVGENRRTPGESVIGDLCRSGEEFLSDSYIVETAVTLLLGGAASPVKLLLDIFSHLGLHQADRLSLVSGQRARPAAIEEFLRFFTPQEIIARTATRDIELGGQPIQAGDRVVLGFGAANRDPRVFEDPNVIKLDRKPNPHLALGRGIHHCLGAALGRAEAAIIVDRVLTRMPGFQLSSGSGDSGRGLRPLVIEF